MTARPLARKHDSIAASDRKTNVFTTNERKLGQMISEPPVVIDGSGNTLIFIEAEEVFPNDQLPHGAMRYRYRAPASDGAPGAVFDFTFKNPEPQRFSFGFRVGATVR